MYDTYVFDPAHDIGIRPHADRTHPPVLNPTAADLMSRSVVAAHANDPVDMAWNLMRGLDVHHLPVVDGGRCIGLVDDTTIALLALWAPSRAATPDLDILQPPPTTLTPE